MPRAGQNPAATQYSGITDPEEFKESRLTYTLAVKHRPAGFAAVGFFLLLGALMAGVAATTLLFQGTSLDRVWVLNPKAYKQLSPHGKAIGILFLLLGVALATAGIGWFRRRLWGWRLAVIIISTQVLGDMINLARDDLLRGGTGVIIAGGLLCFLLRPKIRAAFESDFV